MEHYLWANWNAPHHVHALTTTLHGGMSDAPYFNNLALHVNDHEPHVIANRQLLKKRLNLSTEPAWLNQTHSTLVSVIDEDSNRDVDASITRQSNTPLVVLTADCLPIVMCNDTGTEIAAIHAGWRGLLNGVIQNTCNQMLSAPPTLMAWIGPAICSACYEVSEEIKTQFITRYPFTKNTFINRQANLAHMAELILKQFGISRVYQSGICTFEEKNKCYSYRRMAQTGRMGTLIWFNDFKEIP